MAFLFYAVTVTGIVGYVLQRIYPKLLTQTNFEIIYERIPAGIHELRSNAEAIAIECTSDTGSDTVARHYVETLSWFFQRPRFSFSHIVGGQRGGHWVRHQQATLSRYLSEEEGKYFRNIIQLAFTKNRIDLHYAVQSLLKYWLLVHVPLSVAMVVLALWHLLIVHVYLI